MEDPSQLPAIGDVVVFTDADRKEHKALVIYTFGGSPTPSINLVYVTGDEKAEDQYGRQIIRETSVVHGSKQDAPGFSWSV